MDLYENLTSMCLGNCSVDDGLIGLFEPTGGINVSSIVDQGGTSSQFDGPDAEYADFRDSSRFWVKRVFFPIIMCIGVVGNGLTIIILTRRRMRSSTNHYLTALAFSDTFYLIFAFTLSLNDYSAMTSYAYYSYYRYGLMLTDACSNTSVWLTVTFTIERYVAVCHPIRGKVLCTRSRAKRVIMGVVCLCFLVVIPTPLEWRVVEDVATSKVYLEPSELGANDTYKGFYYWFTSMSFVFVPFTLLAIFNSFLIRSVHRSKTQRRRMTMRGKRGHDHTHQENRITIMLIAVVILFLLCQLPTAVILVYTSIHTDLHPKTNEFAVVLGVGNICNLLVAINAACNFVLYCAFSDRYRRTFLRIFLPCLFRLASPTQSQTTLNTAYTQVDSDGTGHGGNSLMIKRGRNSLMMASSNSRGGVGLKGGNQRINNGSTTGARRGSPSCVNVALQTTPSTNVSNGGAQRASNGSLEMSNVLNLKHSTRLEVPMGSPIACNGNGACLGGFRHDGLRKDSDATNDTSLSNEDLSTIANIVAVPDAGHAAAPPESGPTATMMTITNGRLPAAESHTGRD